MPVTVGTRLRYRDHVAAVESDLWLPLPDLGTSARPVTVDVRRAAVQPGPIRRTRWSIDGQRVVVRLPDVGTAEISGGGRDVAVDDDRQASPFALGHVVASVVLGCAAIVRGEIVLHATALRLGDRAIALTAPSGTGKSTLATALLARGGRVHTDDGCHLDEDDLRLAHTRGWAPLRLLPDAADALGHDPSRLDPMPGTAGKRILEPDARDAPTTLTLDALVVLERAPAETASLVAIRRAAAMPLVASSIYRRNLAVALHGGSWLFDRAAAVAAALPVARLTVPDDLHRLDETADRVVELLDRW